MGCAVNSNSLRLTRAEIGLQAAQGRLEVLKKQLFRCEEQIVATRASLTRSRVELDKTSDVEVVIARQLAKALAKVRLMEEDLAVASRRQAAVAGELAPIVALQAQLATRAESLATLQKQLVALEEQIATATQNLSTKTLALSELKKRLAAFESVRVQFEAAVKALQSPPSVEPPGKTIEKKAPDKAVEAGAVKKLLRP